MEEIIHNRIGLDGMCEIKIVSDHAVKDARMLKFVPGAAREFAKVNCYSTSALSLFYGEVTYPAREVVEFRYEGMPRPRRLAVWRLMEGEGYRMSEIIEYLAQWFFTQTKQRPQYAFVKSLPKSVERFTEVDGLVLLDVEWCLEKCVMVGG